MSYKLDKGCHSVYSIQFYYVCCVKYRRNVLIKEVSEYLKEVNQSVAAKFDIEIMEQETDTDHIRILFRSKPQIQVSKFINSLKSVSARLLFRKFPEIKTKLYSYFLASVGEVNWKMSNGMSKTKVLKTFKYRLYPTKEQVSIIMKVLYLCRFLYNCMLEHRIKCYQAGKSINKVEQLNELQLSRKNFRNTRMFTAKFCKMLVSD